MSREQKKPDLPALEALLEPGEDPALLEVGPDRCEICGRVVGYGIRLFHLGRCDEHPLEESAVS